MKIIIIQIENSRVFRPSQRWEGEKQFNFKKIKNLLQFFNITGNVIR